MLLPAVQTKAGSGFTLNTTGLDLAVAIVTKARESELLPFI